MNISTFKKTLPFLLKHRIVPFLWGSQGVGKTQTIYQYCRENNLELVVLHTATQEVGDLTGLLIRDEEAGTVKHARPEWFPTKGKGVVFLDELNRAPTDVIQAMFPFITEGRLHTHILPEGWRVVSAGNYQSDRFSVTDTSDAAWLSRFCHIDFVPSNEEFLDFVENKGMIDIAAFVREQPSMLELSAKDGGRLDTGFVVPDRRSWVDMLGRLESDEDFPEELKYETYSGIVGASSAAAYLSFLHKKERALSLGQIVHNYNGKTRERVRELSSITEDRRFDLLNQPLDELFVKIENNPNYLSANLFLDNLKQFLLDIPRELSNKAFVKFTKIANFHGKNKLLNDATYVNKFV